MQITTGIKFQLITPKDNKNISLIADWYLGEWNIPIETTVQKIKKLSKDNNELQILLAYDNLPVSTGGLYSHVGLIDRVPRLNIYKNWLALVYTKPGKKGKGIGALICNPIKKHAKNLGLKEIYLFTHTAENLCLKPGWQALEQLELSGKDIVVMKKEL